MAIPAAQPNDGPKPMTKLPDSALKVQDAAEALGLKVRAVEMPASTRTAEAAASACGCSVAQIVKSLVFTGRQSGTPVLLLVSGENRVDEKAFAPDLGEKLRRPDADTVRQITGYAIGGIPPLGHPAPMATWIDEKLLEFDTVWAAAGTPRCVFEVDPNALMAAAGAKTWRF